MTSAYFAGRRAYHEGLDCCSNPHRYYTEERHDWMDGWNDEEFESDERYDREMEMLMHEEDC